MGISHSWNGTVLTITSDSGTSSADLKGDIGIRGPQGQAGFVIDENGNAIVPIIELIITFEDASTTKYKLYGEVITE